MFRLAYIVTHPIQYQAPLLRRLAASTDLDLRVFFLSDFSLHPHREAAFNQTFQWDVPLTDGYTWEVLPRVCLGPSTALRSHWPVASLRQRLWKGDYDAVWVHGWGHVGLRQAVHAAKAAGIPVLLRGESTPGQFDAMTWKRRIRNAYLRRMLSAVAGCLYIGSLNQRFYQELGVPESRLFSVPYAVDNQWFQARCAEAAPHREELRRELKLDAGRPIVLFVGKLIPVKAPDVLLEGFLRFYQCASGCKPYLVFVGDGPLRSQLERQAGAAAGRQVRFLGFRNQSELPALYDLCDLFVLPSSVEPWGLVVNEVMNAAKPVVASDRVGAGPDLVQNGVNGWIFPHNDSDAIAMRLRSAFHGADLKRMGSQSLHRINEWDFSRDYEGILAALEALRRSAHSL